MDDKHIDAFGEEITIGDTIATIRYESRRFIKGVIVKLGKSQVKIKSIHGKKDESWIKSNCAIKINSTEKIPCNHIERLWEEDA